MRDITVRALSCAAVAAVTALLQSACSITAMTTPHAPALTTDGPIEVDELPALHPSRRICVVSETYPPEVNGVARTISAVVQGLRERNHELQLIRPSQRADDAARSEPLFHEVLMRGLPIPRYPRLRMGLVSKRSLVGLWSMRRPDIVHIATDRKSTRLNSSHEWISRMPSSA